ncbi:MAG TPA: hypothetical protein VEA69_01415 [Tepidisphaeraceae bacterium]|nr:hypothetical protein [Tepidisphaeraceae bacterium]
MSSGIQYDAQGRPFVMGPKGPSFISPAAFGQALPGGETSWRGHRWNAEKGEVETPFKWGKLLTTAVGAGLGAGALSAAGVFGGAAGSAAPSAGLTTGASYAAPTSAAAALGGAPVAGASGGGMLGSIVGGVKKGLDWLGMTPRDAIGSAGKALGAYSQGQAQNRDAELSGQFLLERLLMERDSDHLNQLVKRDEAGRSGQKDAWRSLLSAQHFMQPSSRPSSSPYSRPAAMRGDVSGASTLANEAMLRLTGGNPIPMPEKREMAIDPSLFKAGVSERTLGWLAPMLSAMGPRSRPAPTEER